MTDDLTPSMPNPPASSVIVQSSDFAANTGTPVGGFMASPTSLFSGQMTLNATNEQILLGEATAPSSGVGVFMGNAGDGTYDFRAGDPSSVYIWWDASAGTLTVIGSITVTAGGSIGGFDVGSDYIRDAANSMGLASTVTGGDDVRFWAGAAFASRSTAPFRVTEAGNVFGSSITIGGDSIQYVMRDTGYASYGDGSDGAAALDGTTTYNSFSTLSGGGTDYILNRDVYLTSLTINSSISLLTNGYRVFCTGTITNNGYIACNGSNGNNGSSSSSTTGASGGSGGPALSNGFLIGAVAGADGGRGSDVAGNTNATGSTGTAVSNSLGVSGAQGVVVFGGNNGGIGGSGSGGDTSQLPGGASIAGVATAANVKFIANWHLFTLLDISSTGSTIKFNNSAGSAGGGGGGAGSKASGGGTGPCGGGGGGGAGSGGGIIAIYARNIVNSATGNIQAIGGNGGNGGHGATNTTNNAGGGGGGGGGSGGNGGLIILVYNSLSNAGSIVYYGGNGGTGGSGGTGGGGSGASGNPGGNGNTGNTGVLFQFEISL